MKEYIEFFQAHPVLFFIWVGLALGVVVSTIKAARSKVTLVSQQEAVQLLNHSQAVMIDIRSTEVFHKGHISDSVNIQLSELQKPPVTRLNKFKGRPVIAVCEMGHQSEKAAQILVEEGFEQVYNLQGGMSDWHAKNMPVVTR